MRLTAYINFAGRCAEAFDYYAAHLGAVPGQMVRHADGPLAGKLPPGWGNAVLHGQIVIGGLEILAADIPGAEPMRSAYLTLRFDEDAAAERAYAALAEEGTIFAPLSETPFASRFGQLRDRFGINWMILASR